MKVSTCKQSSRKKYPSGGRRFWRRFCGVFGTQQSRFCSLEAIVALIFGVLLLIMVLKTIVNDQASSIRPGNHDDSEAAGAPRSIKSFASSLIGPKNLESPRNPFAFEDNTNPEATSASDVQTEETDEDDNQIIRWSWECTFQEEASTPGHFCVRQHTNHPAEAISFQECSLTCGNNRSLWPMPQKINRLGSGVVEFEPLKMQFHILNISSSTGNYSSQPTPIKKTADFLKSAWLLFTNDIQLYGGQGSKKIPKEKTSPHDKYVVHVYITLGSHQMRQKIGTTSESYSLKVQAIASNRTARVDIFGDTVYGVRHGSETLSQLIDFDPYRKCWILLDEADLEDQPAYPYRGLLIDVTRTFIPMKILKKTVDALGWNKMNVLHLHLTDSQNFPFKSTRIPELQRFAMYNTLLSQGIYGDGDEENYFYSKRALQDLVSYARLRGVKVVPEIDGPAHVNNGWEWAPVLTVCTNDDFKGVSKWKKFCQEPPCGQFDPTHKALYTMLKRLYQDFFEVFDTDFFHMGGDEVNLRCWNQSSTITSFVNYSRIDKSKPLEVLDFVYFWSEVYQKKALSKLDRVILEDKKQKDNIDVVLWTSKLTEPDYVSRMLPSDRYIIQVWDEIDRGTAFKLMEKGFRVIASNYDALYLDCGQADWMNRGQNWCSPQAGWHSLYDFVMPDESYLKQKDPNKPIEGSLLGAEACMWTEQTSHHTLEGKIWPRLSGLAERLWTNPSSTSVKAWDRINLQAHRLLQRGIKADQLQPMWCLLNPGNCFRTPGKK